MTEQMQLPAAPDTFMVRAATLDDVEAVAALFRAHEMATLGKAISTADLLRIDWQEPDWDLADSTQVVLDGSGRVVAYGEVFHPKELPVRPSVWVFVHPDHQHTTIGAALLDWALTSVRRVLPMVPEHIKVTINTSALRTETYRHDLYVAGGLTPLDQSWDKMLIEMDEKPAEPTWPEGFTLKTLAEVDDLRAVYAASRESFQDHRGFVERDFEESFKKWQYWQVETNDKFDPTLWFLVMDGDTIAGINLCKIEASGEPDEGFVSTLGVRPAYRGRGLAKALLIHSFRDFWERGKRKVSLFVDGSSITGANKLYINAGMHIDRSYRSYELVLRDGEEISTQ